MTLITRDGHTASTRCERRPLLGLVVLLTASAMTSPASADDAGQVTVLTVRTPAAVVEFTRDDLLAMEQVEFTTSTIWTTDETTYQGPPLHKVLREAGATEGRVTLTALNDYFAEMDFADLGPRYPILAVLADGQPMSVRQKGPLWVLYPYDDGVEFQTETIYANSVWQLDRISVDTAR